MSLNIVNKKLNIDSNEMTFVYFYKPTCIHCSRLKPVLDTFVNENNVNFYKVDTSKNINFIRDTMKTDTPIKFIPFLLVFKNGNVFKVFSNNITLINLKKVLN